MTQPGFRALVPVVLSAFALALGAACAPEQPRTSPQAQAARCEPPQDIEVQGGEHLIGDREPPVPYNSTPPTSGWHASGPPPFGIHGTDEPLSEPQQVSVLEAGGVVVAYHGLTQAEREQLEEVVREHERAALTSYDAIPAGSVALTAWGVLQRCNALDVAAVSSFINAHVKEEPAAH